MSASGSRLESPVSPVPLHPLAIMPGLVRPLRCPGGPGTGTSAPGVPGPHSDAPAAGEVVLGHLAQRAVHSIPEPPTTGSRAV